jgi:hypothetical protein
MKQARSIPEDRGEMLKSRLCYLVVAFVLLILTLGFSSFEFTCLNFSSLGFMQETTNYSKAEALKVMGLIERIQLEQLEKGSGELRNVVVKESEFNSYVAYRIDVEKEEVMKELRLKFFDDNRVEGKVVVDLRKQKLPKILKPQMTLFLGGELEVKDGYIRVNLEELFLGAQSIQPAVLDLVIFLGSKITGEEAFSMSDWWVLPYGIKDVKTQNGMVTFYY